MDSFVTVAFDMSRKPQQAYKIILFWCLNNIKCNDQLEILL